MGLVPVSVGGVQVTVALLMPATAWTFVGAAGVPGLAAAERASRPESVLTYIVVPAALARSDWTVVPEENWLPRGLRLAPLAVYSVLPLVRKTRSVVGA